MLTEFSMEGFCCLYSRKISVPMGSCFVHFFTIPTTPILYSTIYASWLDLIGPYDEPVTSPLLVLSLYPYLYSIYVLHSL